MRNIPNNLPLQLSFSTLLHRGNIVLHFVFHISIVWVHHRSLMLIQLKSQVGMQQCPQRAQETLKVTQKLLGLQQHHDHQCTISQLGRSICGTVQTIPATCFCVAALVTMTIGVMICTVSVISMEKLG